MKKLIKKIYNILKNFIAIFKVEKYKKSIKGQGDKIYLCNTPIHKNIGDHAIVLSECEFLENRCDEKIIQIPNEYCKTLCKNIKKYITCNDTVIITGGGKVGTIWRAEQEKINHIIKELKNNKIIIMPQSCYFEENIEGKEELEKFKTIVKNHGNVHICLREEKSFEFVKNNINEFRSYVKVPDIVLNEALYEGENKNIKDRDGILFLFRKDRESIISKKEVKDLKNKLKKEYTVYTTDMLYKYPISEKRRENIVNRKKEEFESKKLVITDRLHAMIFAAITRTPCIAVDNINKKVSGTYEWLVNLEYIKMVNSIEEIEPLIDRLINLDNNQFDFLHKDKYENIINMINSSNDIG